MLLPVELTLSVAELLDAPNVFNFAITCKNNWNTCERIINKHASLYAEHKTQELTEPILWEKLVALANDAQLAYYMREITFDGTVYDNDNRPLPLRTERDYADGRMTQDSYNSMMRMTQQLRDICPGTEEEGLHTRIDDTPGCLLTLLLHHLPYLKTLKFQLGGWSSVIDEEYLPLVLRQYASADVKKASQLPFRSLETVVVVGDPGNHTLLTGIEWCRCFISFPSVRNFVACGIAKVDSMGEESTDEIGYRESNLKELALLDSRIDSQDLDFVMTGIKALERFTLTVVSDTMEGFEVSSPVCPRQMVKTIAKHTRHTLQHLEITFQGSMTDELRFEQNDEKTEQQQNSWDHSPLSLRHFKQLRSLRCDWHLLYPEDLFDEALAKVMSGEHRHYRGEDPILKFNLRTILPESLETLHLDGEFENAEWKAIKTNFLDDPDELGLTPNLKSIFIQRTRWTVDPVFRPVDKEPWFTCACASCRAAGEFKESPRRFLKSEAGEAFPCLRNGPLAKYLEGLDV